MCTLPLKALVCPLWLSAGRALTPGTRGTMVCGVCGQTKQEHRKRDSAAEGVVCDVLFSLMGVAFSVSLRVTIAIWGDLSLKLLLSPLRKCCVPPVNSHNMYSMLVTSQ